MEIIFENINKVVLEVLDSPKNATMLSILGKWYFKFIKSDEKRISFYIPNFDIEITKQLFEYIQLFDLTYKLISKNKIDDFHNKSVFDLFGFKETQRNQRNNYALKYIKTKNLIFFGEDTVVSKDRFLPIFFTEQLKELTNDQNNILFNTFKLFKSINKHTLITYPILIDLEKDLSLIITDGKLNDANYALTESFQYNKRDGQGPIGLALDTHENMDIHKLILIRYPNHSNISSLLYYTKDKRIDITLRKRLFYQEILEEDIILLPMEVNEKSIELNAISKYYKVVDTNHYKVLYNLLKDIKKEWEDYEFNLYTTSFPKYWLMFINKGLSICEWKQQFRLDYPIVANKPIIEKIDKIIELIYELNWLEDVIKNRDIKNILLPNINGAQSRMITAILELFKKYIVSNYTTINFIEYNNEYLYDSNTKLFILEAFKIDEISNILQNNNHSNLEFLSPDFLYFSYRPWVILNVFNYQNEVLLNNARQKFDHVNYQKNLSNTIFSKEKILKDIKNSIKIYRDKYIDFEIIQEPSLLDFEDINPSNEEEIELEILKGNTKDRTTVQIEIETESNNIFNLTNKCPVLIQRNTLVNSYADLLKPGDYFIPLNNLISIIEKDVFIDKFSTLSEEVRHWQIRLTEIKEKNSSLYDTLVTKGLTIKESRFLSAYIIPNTQPIIEGDLPTNMPRLQKNWDIICKEIGIDDTAKNQARIAYFGRNQITRLKDLYKCVLKLLFEEYLDKDETSKINEVENILQKNSTIWNNDAEMNYQELAKSMIKSIYREIKLYKVLNVKTIINE